MAGGSTKAGRKYSGVQGRGRRLAQFWTIWTGLLDKATLKLRGILGELFWGSLFPGIVGQLKCQVSDVLYNYCLVFLPFLVIVHIWDTKPWLSAADPAAPLPWGLKDFVSLSFAAADKGCLMHHLFQSFLWVPWNIFQAIPFKRYLLAVKKIDPLQALGFLKRGLKIAQGTRQLQLLGNGALCLHFCRFPFQPCSWKPVALPLLGTDARGRRNGPGPSPDLGSHLASVNAERRWGNGEWAYQALGFEKAYSILYLHMWRWKKISLLVLSCKL